MDFEPQIHARVDVYSEGKIYPVTVNLTHTFPDVKKQLKDIVKMAPSDMRIFYKDVGAPTGQEEIKSVNKNRPLHSYHVKDGDEFHIVRKFNIKKKS